MRIFLTAAIAGMALFGVSAGEAAPMVVAPMAIEAAPLQTPAVSHGDEARITLVRGGCGFGAHRSFRGFCRYNRGWRGRVRYRHDHWRRWRYWR